MKDLIEFIELIFKIITSNPVFYVPISIGILYTIGVELGIITDEMRQYTVNPPPINR